MLNSNRKKFSPQVKRLSRKDRLRTEAIMRKAYAESEARRQIAKVGKHETRD